MNVLHVATDPSLAAGLAAAQARAGMRPRLVVPLASTAGLARRLEPIAGLTVWEGTLAGGRVLVHHLDALEGFVAKTAVEAARATGFAPDVVHAHDLAAAPALASARPAAAVLTLRHPPAGGQLPSADLVTLPSARAARAFPGTVGVLAGVDTDRWNPAGDPYLPAHFSAGDLAGKQDVKTRLQRDAALPARPAIPVFAVVGVGAEEGTGLLVEAAHELLAIDAQWVILGRGERRFEDALGALMRRHPNRLAFRADAEKALIHRAYAGADFLVAPALADPGGTAAMIALRHGTLPVVNGAAGLDDVVVDYDPVSHTGSGFKLAERSGGGLVAAVKRAIALHRDVKNHLRLAARAMELDFSWDAAARKWAELYLRTTSLLRS